MTNTLFNNSYRILGLDNSASLKEINKRSKDIINLLAIDEKPHYDLDFDILDSLRTEAKVKESAQNLGNPKKKIVDYFFWFDIQDSTDQKAADLIKKMDTVGARDIWAQAIENNSSKKEFYQKNLAILDLFILSEKDAKYSIEESLKIWKELLSSDKFWSDFVKIYKLNDDLDTSTEVIDNFRNNASSVLSDIYADLGEKNNTELYLKEFIKLFGAKGENVDKNVLTPLYQEINKNISILEQIKPELDKMIEPIIKTKIRKAIKSIELTFNEIVKLGIYEDSQTIVLRDKAAMAIRSLALDVNNVAKDYKTSLEIIESAPLFAATELTKSKVNDDLLIIKGNEAGLELNDILELVSKGDFEEAILVVNHKLENQKLSKEARKQLQEFKRSYEERVKTFGKPVKNAPPLFTFWGFGTTLYGDTLYLTALFIPVIPIARYSVQSQLNGKYLFTGKLSLRPKQKLWFWAGLIIFGLYILYSLGTSSNSTPSNVNSSPTYNNSTSTGDYSCSDSNVLEADSMKPSDSDKTNLDNEKNDLTTLKSQIDSTTVDNYDQNSVDSYNSLVDQYNQKKDVYNTDLNTYNNKIDAYNNFLDTNCTKK
jgi:hypothetical protein